MSQLNVLRLAELLVDQWSFDCDDDGDLLSCPLCCGDWLQDKFGETFVHEPVCAYRQACEFLEMPSTVRKLTQPRSVYPRGRNRIADPTTAHMMALHEREIQAMFWYGARRVMQNVE